MRDAPRAAPRAARVDLLDRSGWLVTDRLDRLLRTGSLRMPVPMTDRTGCSPRSTASKGLDRSVASCTDT